MDKSQPVYGTPTVKEAGNYLCTVYVTYLMAVALHYLRLYRLDSNFPSIFL